MAGAKSDISLQIQNNLNRTVKFSILGGTQDPSNGQANAKTLYEWDLSAETFANTTVLSIQASTVTNPTVITYEVSNQDGAIEDLETVVRLLNTLNLGVFNLDGNVVWIVDDINIFGDLEVLVSLTFDINTFVTSAYNYFDPLGQTSLPSFILRWTPSIQQAVNTVPNFVSKIDTIGWSLAYPITEEVNITKFNVGDSYVITSASTTKYVGAFMNQAGTGDAIVYMSDLSLWSNMILFRVRANSVSDSIIFKYIADALNVEFQADLPTILPPPNKSWIPLDFSNFPSYTNNNSQINLTDINTLDLMNAYPSIAVLDGSSLEFSSINYNTYDIDVAPIGAIDFGGYPTTLGSTSVLILNRLINSATNQVGIDFSTLNFSGQNQSLTILQGFGAIQTFLLSAEFNTKFSYATGQSGNTFRISGEGFALSLPIITFIDDLTPLTLNFTDINFEFADITNLPPLDLVGVINVATYILNLNLSNYSGANNTQYYNDWLGKLGSQSDLNGVINTVAGSLDITDGTLYTLSGRGVSGYYALLEQGAVIFAPFTAIIPNSFSFTLADGGRCIIETNSAGASSFAVNVTEFGSATVTENSGATAPTTQLIDFGIAGDEKNCIFSSDPVLPCTNFFIGKQPAHPQTETLTNLLIGNGAFGQTLGFVGIKGLTLSFDIDINNQGGAYGLYNRDFSGLDSTNTSVLTIESLVTNCLKIATIIGVAPFGSNAIINIPTVNPIPELNIINSDFGLSNPLTDNNFRPLNVLFDAGAINNNGTQFNTCRFGLNNLPSTETDVFFAINDDNGGTTRNALLGFSRLIGCKFSTVGTDALIFEANYNGVGNNISSLELDANADLRRVQLLSIGAVTPPAMTITLGVHASLEEFQFENYNVTSISLAGLPVCSDFRVNDNDLNSGSLDDIITTLDANGLTNGTLDYSNQTGGASPTIVGSGASYNNLLLKGWTVTGNVPI